MDPRAVGIAPELIARTGPAETDEDRRYQCESCGETFAVGDDGMLKLTEDS